MATPTTSCTPDDTVIQHTVVLAGKEHHPDMTSFFWIRCFGVQANTDILFFLENGLLVKLLPLTGSQSPGYVVLWVWHRQSLWLVVYIWLFYPKHPDVLPSLCPLRSNLSLDERFLGVKRNLKTCRPLPRISTTLFALTKYREVPCKVLVPLNFIHSQTLHATEQTTRIPQPIINDSTWTGRKTNN